MGIRRRRPGQAALSGVQGRQRFMRCNDITFDHIVNINGHTPLHSKYLSAIIPSGFACPLTQGECRLEGARMHAKVLSHTTSVLKFSYRAWAGFLHLHQQHPHRSAIRPHSFEQAEFS
jgi:hypothetical protein